MLPPRPMVTIKNFGWVGAGSLAAVAALALLTGCSPPGPAALLKGEQLIENGRHAQAAEKLKTATALLPKEARAFNLLGLAYHGNHQPEEAARAYRQALDLDHKLAAARYNLGCLLLEQNLSAAAADELTSYTFLQPRAVDGWVKLGTAQLRARRLDAAEKCFRTALDLQPKQAEAINGLGVVAVQRRKLPEAAALFTQALTQSNTYAPAVFNLAVLNHQYLNNHALALRRYRGYLELQPRSPQVATVESLVRTLEAELQPASRATLTSQVTSGTVRTNPATANATPGSRGATNPPLVNTVPAARTNPPGPVVPSTTRVATATNLTPPTPTDAVTNPPIETAADLEVTRLADDPVVRPAQDLASLTRPGPTTPSTSTALRIGNPPSTNAVFSVLAPRTEPKKEKRGFWQRVNPFGGKSKPEKDKSQTETTPPQSNIVLMAAPAPAAVAPPPVAPPPAPPPLPRYSYLSPARPAAGNRPIAENFFSQGLKAQKEGRGPEALAAYQKAAQADPSYFNAYFNAGLLAYDTGDSRQALAAYERALAVDASSTDARYNLALTLKQAGYPLDAAIELEKILSANPGETRAHLSLGNLYAQQLVQAKQARAHYLKVLENNPRHPKAADIRLWLASNP